MCVLLASTAKLRSAAGSGWVRVATAARVSLTNWKLCFMAGAQDQLQSALGGQEDVRRRRDEPPIKTHHPQEGLKLLLFLGGWEVLYRLHVLEDRRRPFSGDLVAQEINLLASQLTFLHVEDQAILLKLLKNQVKMM